MVKVSVVAPAYNEEKIIEEFVKKVDKTLKKQRINSEILIVNDASTDKTGSILNALSRKYPNLRVIHNRKNLGLTGASWKGFNEAKGDIIVFLPSDLESNPEEDIPKLLSALDKKTDLVVGWRYNRRQGFVKTVISKTFNSISNLLFHVKVHDLGWVKAFRKDIIYNIESLRSDWHRFFVILAANEGYRVKEVKTKYHKRKAGKSKFGKFGFKRLPGGFFDLIVVKFHLSFSKKPMFMFGSAGLILLLLGFIGALYLLYIKLLTGTIIERLPLLFLVVLLILFGTQLFALGFLSEQLVTIREGKVRKR